VGVKLGCLNQAQLTHLGIEARGVSFAGWIANQAQRSMARAEENLATLERLIGEPALARVPYSRAQAPGLVLAQAAARLAEGLNF
jgi:dethiobiotin synthetase